jgi:hypothetical protein
MNPPRNRDSVSSERKVVEAAMALSSRGFVIPTTGLIWTPEGYRPRAS